MKTKTFVTILMVIGTFVFSLFGAAAAVPLGPVASFCTMMLIYAIGVTGTIFIRSECEK